MEIKWHFNVSTLNYTYFGAILKYERPFPTSNRFVKTLKFFFSKSYLKMRKINTEINK